MNPIDPSTLALHVVVASAASPDPAERAGARIELDRRAGLGDEAAIAALPVVYYDAVVATALARGAPAMTAVDVAQETFLRLTLRCRRGPPELKVLAYARVIASNLVEDWRRGGRWLALHPGVDDPDFEDPSAAGGVGADGGLDAKELLGAYEELLAEQDDRRRDIVHRWLHGADSADAIGARWGTTAHAAKVVVWRFRKELEARLRVRGWGFA